MKKEHLKTFKQKLLAEKQQLEEELSSVGEEDPELPDHWDPKPEDMDTDSADSTEMANLTESYGENATILTRLQERYSNVKAALVAIENGIYGICDICGEEIEAERLEANPTALTCIAHREKE